MVFSGCGSTEIDNGSLANDLNLDSLNRDEFTPAALNQMEADLHDQLRANVKDAIGADADQMFAQIDQARSSLLAANQAKLIQSGSQPASGSQLSQQRLPSGNNLTSARSRKFQLAAGGSVFTNTLGLLNGLRNDREFVKEGSNHSETTQSEGPLSCKVKQDVTRSGSKLISEVEADCSITGITGMSVTEKAKGRFEIEICPDEQGAVPVTFTYGYSVDFSGPTGQGAIQIDLSGTATGHVNDDAALVGMDSDSTASQSVQGTVLTGADGGKFAEGRTTISVSGINTSDSKAGDIKVSGNAEITRSSSNADSDYLDRVMDMSKKYMTNLLLDKLKQAENLWTDGFCVEVVVAGVNDSNEVERYETKQFTGKVRHKFEGNELNIFGLQGTLTGEKELKPTEKKEAPVSYTYKAPDEEDKQATVRLETRSKRGAASKSISFRTKKKQAYTASGGSKISVTGTICSLEAGFNLTGSGQNGLAYSYAFSPAGAKAGSMSYTGSGSGCTESGTGPYTVSLSDDEKSGTITYNVSGNVTCPGISAPFSGSETFNITEAPPGTCSTG